jgi:hypothetical protein
MSSNIMFENVRMSRKDFTSEKAFQKHKWIAKERQILIGASKDLQHEIWLMADKLKDTFAFREHNLDPMTVEGIKYIKEGLDEMLRQKDLMKELVDYWNSNPNTYETKTTL